MLSQIHQKIAKINLFCFDLRKEGTWQNLFVCRFEITGVVVIDRLLHHGIEKEGAHSLFFMLLHVARYALPMDQVGGVFASHRPYLMGVRLWQVLVTMLDLINNGQLVLGIVFFENFADRLVHLAVHLQQVCLGDLSVLSRLDHVEHAVQLYLVIKLFLGSLFGRQFHVLLIGLCSLRCLVLLQGQVRTGRSDLGDSGCAGHGQTKRDCSDQQTLPVLFGVQIRAQNYCAGRGFIRGWRRCAADHYWSSHLFFVILFHFVVSFLFVKLSLDSLD